MIINSILDTDLYKVTQQQAICQLYPHAQARYTFINRGETPFPKGFEKALNDQIRMLSKLQLTDEEAKWLQEKCPFLTPVFIDFLKGYRYNPKEVLAQTTSKGELCLDITGPWYRTVLWEVPLMAIISELYFKLQDSPNITSRLNDARHKASIKSMKMLNANVKFADFGTRRRYSEHHHDGIISYLQNPNLVGSSNMYFAKAYNLKPIGTQAHEWIMFHAAKYGYGDANRMAMKKWVDVFHGNLGIALSDTFTTDIFLKSFGLEYAKLFDGVRQDSGDPFEFAGKIVDHYEYLGIDPRSKTIVFSDSLNPTKAIQLDALCKTLDIKCSFGIGTNLTNDIEGIKPLNMVIKMSHCKPYGENGWLPVVKLSDTPSKHTGHPEEVALCKKLLRIS